LANQQCRVHVIRREFALELWFPITLMLVLSTTVAVVVGMFGRRLHKRAIAPAGLALAAAFIGFILALRGRVEWLSVIPLADAVIYCDWTPILGAAVIGFAWSHIPGKPRRKLMTLVPLAGLTLWLAYGTLLRPTPHCNDSWQGDVCLQTSESSCSAACAATLLRGAGQPATEAELARLCLTCDPRGSEPGGTTLHGLYRGLKLKTAGTALRVDARRITIEDLLREGSGPWIISVGLTNQQAADPIYREQYGWSPGMRHSVVLFRQVTADRVEIGDPSVGREQWSLDDLRILWRGDAVRLVETTRL